MRKYVSQLDINELRFFQQYLDKLICATRVDWWTLKIKKENELYLLQKT